MLNNKKIFLFSTAYLPPIEYFIGFLKAENALLEIYEQFKRRNYFNHCLIANAIGLHQLTIPISKTHSNFAHIKDVRIDYTENWQRIHWKTLETSYNTSPFFLYYKDQFEPFYAKKTTFLLDYNMQLFELICSLLKINYHFTTTKKHISQPADNFIDLRKAIDLRKRKLPNYPFLAIAPYQQTFSDKTGFITNLSILDLLFNKGYETKDYLIQHLHLL